MIKIINRAKSLLACFLVLLQVSASCCCGPMAKSVVHIYLDRKFVATGVLVQDNYVVTSFEALLGKNLSQPLVVLGNVKNLSEILDHYASVENVIKDEVGRDLTVLKLKKSITGGEVQPAKLCDLESIPEGEPFFMYNSKKHPDAPDMRQLIYYASHVANKSCDLSLDDNSLLCAEPNENFTCSQKLGSPVEIRGQFCGIYFSLPNCWGIDRKELFITSLITRKNKEFLDRTLPKEC